jgi:chloride channel protein, CIC family
VMSRVFDALAPTTPIPELRERLQRAPWGEVFLIDESGCLTGVITFADLHETAFDTSHDAELIAENLARKRPTVLAADDDLESAFQTFTICGEVNLPVVENHDSMLMIGVAQEHEVVLAYHRARDRARGEERSGD